MMADFVCVMEGGCPEKREGLRWVALFGSPCCNDSYPTRNQTLSHQTSSHRIYFRGLPCHASTNLHQKIRHAYIRHHHILHILRATHPIAATLTG